MSAAAKRSEEGDGGGSRKSGAAKRRRKAAARASVSELREKGLNPDGLPMTEEELATRDRVKERTKVYMGGERVNTKRNVVTNPKLREKLDRLEGRIKDAAEMNVAREEMLLTEEVGYLEAEGEMESTGKVTQREIAANVQQTVAQQVYNLDLEDFGPYRFDWTRNGRHMLLGGNKGHVAIMDVLRMNLVTELHLRETLRDVCFLHNETLFATAQRKYVYIYDQNGVELHCLRQHVEPTRLSFLPYHFLLAAVGKTGYLKYQDTSTGELVSEHRTKLGACDVMAQNTTNGVIHLGHGNGVVTLWSPAMSTPLVRMLAHQGPVKDVAVDPTGRYMASAGMNKTFKIWDLRTFKELHSYTSVQPAASLEFSQRGLLAVGFGSHIQVWRDACEKKARAPYMRHELPGKMASKVSWRPFEDVLGVGHSDGFTSMVVPGAGEPNYDALEANPFESTKERRETEVHSLLDKIGPETIALDSSFLGTIDTDSVSLAKEQDELTAAAVEAAGGGPREKREVRKQRGKSKTGRKLKKKRKNIMDAEKALLKKRLEDEKEERRAERAAEMKEARREEAPAALRRFVK